MVAWNHVRFRLEWRSCPSAWYCVTGQQRRCYFFLASANNSPHCWFSYDRTPAAPLKRSSSDLGSDASGKRARSDSDSSASALEASPDRLSAEQRRVVNLVLAGKSVFFTGYAGTGKSVWAAARPLGALASIDFTVLTPTCP